MKNPKPEVLASAVKARLGGMTVKDVLAQFNLSHSQYELAEMRLHTYKDRIGTVPATPAGIARERANGTSWGVISVLADIPESRVRRLYAETGVKSEGQRIGAGGRFYYGDSGQALYSGELAGTGTIIPVGAKGLEGALGASSAQAALLAESPEALIKRFCALTGRKGAKGMTKAELVIAIIKAEAAPTRPKRVKKAEAPSTPEAPEAAEPTEAAEAAE